MISCIMCTFGRLVFVRRSLAYWLAQDHPDRELVIFNTHPTPLHLTTPIDRVRIVNQPDLALHPLGVIRQEALKYASGDVYSCWDDDDIFLPWHLSQGMQRKGSAPAWKPVKSYWTGDGGKTYSLAENAMEASWLVDMALIRHAGFAPVASGGEHRDWLAAAGPVAQYDDVSPFWSYAYCWGQGLHHISGDGNNPQNMMNHARAEGAGGGDGMLSAADVASDYSRLLHAVRGIYSPADWQRLADRLQPFTKGA